MPEVVCVPLDELRAKETVAWDSLSKYKFIMFGYHAAVWVTLNRIHRCRQRNPFLDVVKLAKVKIQQRRNPKDMKPLVERQQREDERGEIVKKAVEAADRIILDGSNGSVAETDFLTARVAEKLIGKALQPFYRNMFSEDLKD